MLVCDKFQVEAAVALQMLLSGQEDRAEKYVEPHIRPITLELLNIIRETENDELTTVMQKIVSTYTEQLMPVAVEICQHLVTTFGQVCCSLIVQFTKNYSSLIETKMYI